MKRFTCQIIPDDVLKKIEKNGTQSEKIAVKKTLIESAKIRKRRELAPVPQPHAQGEDRQVYDAENKTDLPGKLVRTENDLNTGDQTVDETFDASGNFYRLLLAEFKRKSFDGNGARITSVVHFDKNFDNAYWDGERYVEGDGFYFNPFSRDLTVPGHEIGHAVVQYSANLEYQGQSGALNEHLADVFGCLTEQYAYTQDVTEASWLIGQLICEGKIKSGSDKPAALRNMLEPGTGYNDPIIGRDPQGADMSHYDPSSDDNGGVHVNSGIPNRAFALACKEVGGFAWEKIGQIWYQVLTTRAKSSTKFQAFANMTYVSAEVLFGPGSKEQLAIQGGWDAVEIDATKADEPAPAPSPLPDSPCMPAILAALSDQKVLQHIRALARRKSVRELLKQIDAGLIGTTEED
jgi:Zn-dependent metalloprotease